MYFHHSQQSELAFPPPDPPVRGMLFFSPKSCVFSARDAGSREQQKGFFPKLQRVVDSPISTLFLSKNPIWVPVLLPPFGLCRDLSLGSEGAIIVNTSFTASPSIFLPFGFCNDACSFLVAFGFSVQGFRFSS